MSSICDELEALIDRFSIRQAGFVDPIFPLEKKFALELCDELIRRGINRRIVWTTETKIDLLDEDMIIKMREAGCRRLIFGLESGSKETLDKVNKDVDFDKIDRVIMLLKKHKLQSIGLFMIGLPGESREDIMDTFRYACSVGVDFANFAMTVPFPGSVLYDELLAAGKIRSNNWEDFTTFNPDPKKVSYVPDNMTPEELIGLQKKGTKMFYMRPGMIWKQLVSIRTVSPDMILKGIYCLFT